MSRLNANKLNNRTTYRETTRNKQERQYSGGRKTSHYTRYKTSKKGKGVGTAGEAELGIFHGGVRTSDGVCLRAGKEVLHKGDRIIGRFAMKDRLVRVAKDVEENTERVAGLGGDKARGGKVALDCLVGTDSITKAEIVLRIIERERRKRNCTTGHTRDKIRRPRPRRRPDSLPGVGGANSVGSANSESTACCTKYTQIRMKSVNSLVYASEAPTGLPRESRRLSGAGKVSIRTGSLSIRKASSLRRKERRWIYRKNGEAERAKNLKARNQTTPVIKTKREETICDIKTPAPDRDEILCFTAIKKDYALPSTVTTLILGFLLCQVQELKEIELGTLDHCLSLDCAGPISRLLQPS